MRQLLTLPLIRFLHQLRYLYSPSKVILFSLFFLGLLFSKSSYAQSPYFISHFFDKISDAKISVIQQDKRGFIWIGSDRGLYRYDGINYKLFLNGDSTGTESVTALYCDHNQIWAGYEDGRIFYVDQHRNLIPWMTEEGLPQVAITGFARDTLDRLWFSTYGEGVYVKDADHLYNFNNEDGLLGNEIYKMVIDRSGDIWVATDNGLNICQFQNKVKSVREITTEDGLLDDIVYTLTADHSGIWIGFHSGGLCHYHLQSQEIDYFTMDWQFGSVRAICSTSSEIWVGTEHDGIINYKLDKSEPLMRQQEQSDPFPKQTCHQVFSDQEGNLWLVIDDHFIYSGIVSVKAAKLELGDIQAICQDSKDRIWIASQEGLFEFKEGKLMKTRWQGVNIISLFEDPYGKIWIGTFGDGVICWDPLTNQSLRLSEKDGLANGSIFSIDGFEDRIWLATLGGIVEIYNNRHQLKNEVIRFLNLDNSSGLNANFFYKVFVDKDGVVWFGTDGQGVIKLENEVVTNLLSSGDLPIKTAYSIAQDDLGNIWFGTNNEGAYSFNGDTFVHYDRKDGLSNSTISSIALDQSGNILLIHDNGFDLFDPQTKTIRYYGENAGIHLLNPGLNAISDGRNPVWIGGHNMLVRYLPDVNMKQIYPAMTFDEISVFNEPVDFNISHKFGYNENFLQFNYVGIWHTDPQNVKYQFKLEGYDINWRESKDHVVSYSKLAPGNYSFRVRSMINDKAIIPSEINYDFFVKKPFWVRSWFLAIMALIVGGGVYGYQRYRELRISRNAALERERIESQYEVLKAQINPHFLFNSFNTLANIVEEDADLAIEYIEKLSDYYRSIIQFRNQKMISLNEELVLIDDFTYLLKKRFGKNLSVVKEIKDTEYYIPPLTLQMLVENAVKHNVISKQKPLVISIRSQNDDYLVVANNLQPKKTEEPSTKFGLQNIKTRFELLTNKKVLIESNEDQFVIYIPLIKYNVK